MSREVLVRGVRLALLGAAISMTVPGCGPKGSSTCEPGVTCDAHLDPPAQGQQLTAGPFFVAPGTEALRCYWRRVNSDMDIGQIEVAYNVGSHHIDIYQVDYTMPESDSAGFDCSKPEEWGQWPSQLGVGGFTGTNAMPKMVVGFQNAHVDWTLPDGVAYQLKAGTQLLVQSHYANAQTQVTPTTHLLDFINFVDIGRPLSAYCPGCAQSPPLALAETLFDEDTMLNLPPHSTTVVTRRCVFPQAINIIGMFGHFHSRGASFDVSTYDPDTNTVGAPPFYVNTTWSSPPWMTTTDWGGPIVTKGIQMVATYINQENRTITWGYFVDLNEHMETYTMFYPRLNLDDSMVCQRISP